MWRDALIAYLATRPGGIVAYLFGRQARGTAVADSDIDVGIWSRQRPTTIADRAFELAGDLEQRIGKPVDVVVMSSAPSELVPGYSQAMSIESSSPSAFSSIT